MKKEEIHINSKLCIILALFFIILLSTIVSARYEPEEPSLEANLTKFDYSIVEPLEGFLILGQPPLVKILFSCSVRLCWTSYPGAKTVLSKVRHESWRISSFECQPSLIPYTNRLFSYTNCIQSYAICIWLSSFCQVIFKVPLKFGRVEVSLWTLWEPFESIW